ncbi:MAG: glyoxalase [Terrisporobacter othiniensis]|uniref:VOC family protein n=1 Tax=Terrisporobacter othiniensis TaxID=1577792 RepID=UPI002909D140|nr:VOC family protein [Terrisporobacter othiniensis]MDU6984715.1 glyoxalase [Terrisporobacter othiniensis]
MKFSNPLIVVSDMEKSKLFYSTVLGLDVILDFGANVTLTGGIALQTKESWCNFIHKSKNEIFFGSNNSELYFEDDNFDNFILNLNQIPGICYVHPVIEHTWGQRVVRFYDPDMHIIEVGENLNKVVKRFLSKGMSAENIASRMDMPVDYVKSCL